MRSAVCLSSGKEESGGKMGGEQNRLSCFSLDGKTNAESLKGVIYGNPALQGGEQACRTNPSGGRHSPKKQRLEFVPRLWPWNVGRGASRLEVPSSRQDVLVRIPPP